ncbi:ATP-dependent helicase [Candidatus Fermentibacterales bacterium]|nr:ATP-dependent helicase [Candidatus Fermentibacterales bacterium]
MELNPEQRAAAEHEGRHVLVLAGAGTGKTRTIIARAIHLLERDADPRRLLLLTFTRRAAREMVHRLRSEVGPGAESIPAGTFHHFCLVWMRRMRKLFDSEGSTVIDRDDQLQLMKLSRATVRRRKEVFPRASDIVDMLSYSRNTNTSFEDYLERFTEFGEDVTQRLLECASDYTARKKRSRYLDYDDLLFLMARKLHADERVRERLRGAYDHILVDEMQDTNPLQWLILDALRDPALLFCVGDDAQSIYAFRGADFRNVHSFTGRVPGSVILRLRENYRSTQEILDLSNWLLSESALEYSKDLRAHRGSGSMPRLVECEDELAEASWVVDHMIESHESGRPWRDHMIIARSAWASRSVEAEMVRRDVPYRFIGGTRLFSAAHVKDLLCMLRASASPADHIAWLRYLTLWPGIGDVSASHVIEGLAEGRSPEATLGLVRGLDDGLRRRVAMGVEIAAENWSAPARAISASADFLSPLLETRYPNWSFRKRDFELLSGLAARFRSMPAFLETYALDPISSTEVERQEDDDAVVLITAPQRQGHRVPDLLRREGRAGLLPAHQVPGRPGPGRGGEEGPLRRDDQGGRRADHHQVLQPAHGKAGHVRCSLGARGTGLPAARSSRRPGEARDCGLLRG